MGHSLIRSLIPSHRSLIRSLRTAHFDRALRCAHSFARLLTHSLLSSWESGIFLSTFQSVLNHCVMYFLQFSDARDGRELVSGCGGDVVHVCDDADAFASVALRRRRHRLRHHLLRIRLRFHARTFRHSHDEEVGRRRPRYSRFHLVVHTRRDPYFKSL